MFRLLIAATAALATAALTLPAAAQDHGTPARAAIVIDLSSDAVLLEKNADEALPPASMSKLMTLYMVFEALERGVISMDDMFRTSKRASSMAGSKMFLREGEQASVADLAWVLDATNAALVDVELCEEDRIDQTVGEWLRWWRQRG